MRNQLNLLALAFFFLAITAFPINLLAGDLKVELPDSDGTSAFKVMDLDSNVLLRVGSSGTLAVGTDSPGAKMDFVGEGASNAYMMRVLNTGGPYGLQVRSGSTADDYPFYVRQFGGENNELFVVRGDGKVGIGILEPQYDLDVEGVVQAQAYLTGDIIFQKNGRKLWRMFEDENGLYLENQRTGAVSKIFMEKDLVVFNHKIKDLEEKLVHLEKVIEQLKKENRP